MSKIAVIFNKGKEQVKKPSEMVVCKPFVARLKGTNRQEVLIRTGGNAFLFFGEEGSCSYTLEENSYWVDENYEALPNAKATVILEV